MPHTRPERRPITRPMMAEAVSDAETACRLFYADGIVGPGQGRHASHVVLRSVLSGRECFCRQSLSALENRGMFCKVAENQRMLIGGCVFLIGSRHSNSPLAILWRLKHYEPDRAFVSLPGSATPHSERSNPSISAAQCHRENSFLIHPVPQNRGR